MGKKEILIIKTGYSEVLDNSQSSFKPSFGDILRTTPLLHLYKSDNVTWVTDKDAFPLLEGNTYIHKLLPLEFTSAMHLLEEDFDILINLEKNHDICNFSKRISAWRKHGFRIDAKTQRVEAYDRAYESFSISSDPEMKKKNKRHVQELLFEMAGSTWKGEKYILPYSPKISKKYDICLNNKIGQKWPTKAWPEENWNRLEKMLVRRGLKVSRQDKQGKEVLENLYSYMDWINSGEVLVTNDSLGMHLGICFEKKVLGLFGATPHAEVYFYGNGKAILPSPYPDCAPCFKGICERGNNCMEEIFPEEVYDEVLNILTT